MKLITIHKSIYIISLLHLFVNVAHSVEPSTSVTLSGATEQPSSLHFSKRITTSATDNIDTASDTNYPVTSNDMTQQDVVTPNQSSTQDPQTSAPYSTDPVVTTDPPVESTTDPAPTTTSEPTSSDANTSSDQPTTSASEISSTTPPVESTTTSSESSVAPTTSSQASSSTSSSRHSRSATSSQSQSSSQQPSSTSSNAPTASASSQPDNSGSNNTGTIVGAVVGGVVGAALIIGLLIWFNRKGGCTKRRKNEIDQNDYTIDMNQTDFSPAAGAAAGGAAASVAAASKVAANEPVSPFDHSRRFVPATSNANYEGEYDGYNNYPAAQNDGYNYQDQQQYAYYDANGYPQQQQQYGYEGGAYDQYDSNRHEVHSDNHSHYTGPSASRTSGSEWNQGVVSDKPNLRDQKPNQA